VTQGAASRRGLLGAAALLGIPGIAAAQRNATPPPVLWLPAFDDPSIALLRALVGSPAFQRSLAVGVEPAGTNDGALRYGADLGHAQRLLRSYLGFAAAHWTPAQRSAAEAAHRWDGFFDPTDNPAYRPNLYRGDTADQATLFLQQLVMMERAQSDDLTLPSGQHFWEQTWLIRGQVLAAIAETPAIRSLDEAGRRSFGLWLRLNYVAMSGVIQATDVLYAPAPRLRAAARDLVRQGVETAPFLRRIGLDPETLRLRPDGLRDTVLMAAAR